MAVLPWPRSLRLVSTNSKSIWRSSRFTANTFTFTASPRR
ncbi:Uncharacterised protein [Vibrio cholerae]|nr:Uncharacterised protein [Vibrio cholerae]